MSFSFFNKTARAKVAEDKINHALITPTSKPRVARLTRKTRTLALAAHIGHAGKTSRLGRYPVSLKY
ncbi:MAG: hypothetical protein Q8L63_03900 [Alphaproteobacteria bacterium]|nr:hypothetical protein [Alphaproteobacteria bacterium]